MDDLQVRGISSFPGEKAASVRSEAQNILGDFQKILKRSVEEVDGLAKEIENTIHFIEDREKQAVTSLWFRNGLLDGGDGLAAALAAKLAVPVKPVPAAALDSLPEAERAILTPLAGLIP